MSRILPAVPLYSLLAAIGAALTSAQPAAGAGLSLQALTNPGAVSVGCPFQTGDSKKRNAGYLDVNAYYGVAQIPLSLPDGASIRIEGSFPKVRYFSLQSYDGARSGNLIDSLPDALITPTTGAALNPNPAALPDSANYTNHYVVTIRYADPPANAADREPNTLYAGAPAFTTPNRVSKQVMYRTYLANPGSSLNGDVPVPDAVYSGPTGDIDFNDTPDAAKCDRINGAAGLALTISPALVAPRKIAFVAANHARDAGFYPNGDANYLRSSSSQSYAPIVIVRAKRFVTPVLPGETPDATDPDVRYWSFCHYALATGAVVSCAVDRELIAQADGYNSIVLSSKASRPPLATVENGYNWLDTADNPGEEFVLRQLLARPGFAGDYALAAAAGNTPLETTLGEWAPEATYCDEATFAAYATSGGEALFKACYAAFYKPLPGGLTLPTLPRP